MHVAVVGDNTVELCVRTEIIRSHAQWARILGLVEEKTVSPGLPDATGPSV